MEMKIIRFNLRKLKSITKVPLNQEGKEKEPISITVGFDISKTSDNWDLYSYILQWNGSEIKENIEFTIVNEYNPLYSYDFSIISSSSSIEPPKTFLSYATTIPPFIITGDLLTGTVLTDKDYVTNYTLNINPLDTTGSNPDDEVYITIYYTGLTNMYFWFDNSNFPTVSTHVFDYGSSSGEKFLIGNKEPYTVFTGTGNNIEFNKGDTSNVYLCRDIYNTSEKVYGPYTFRFSGNNTIDIR